MMNARKALTILIAVCLLLALGATRAGAQQITLGASSQNITFTGNGGNSLDVTLGSCVAGVCTLSGLAIGADGEAGTYSLVTTIGTDNPDFGPNNGFGVFPLSNADGTTTVFNFTDTVDGDSNVSVAVTYVDVANGSGSPRLEFTTPLSSMQDEITLGTLTCSVSPCNIDNVASTGGGATASGLISSGQVVTPEPGTMALFGTGLLVLGGAIRRRWGKQI